MFGTFQMCIFGPYADNLFNFSLLELIISVCLGFLSAMLVEALWKNNNEKEMKKQLLSALCNELKKVKEDLSELHDNEAYLNPFHVPVWRGACESGTILCLSKKSYFNDLLYAYSQIEESNLIETKAFEIFYSNNCKTEVHRQKLLSPVRVEF